MQDSARTVCLQAFDSLTCEAVGLYSPSLRAHAELYIVTYFVKASGVKQG